MADVQRDKVVKFCNLTDSNKNGKYGLYRKKLGDGRHRIMQTSGCDLAVKRENFEVYELDLNQEITNGVVLVFPPSTGKTGTKPVAVPLPDFPHEVSANGMTYDQWTNVRLPNELNTERMTDLLVLLNTREMQILKEYFDWVDGADFENFMKDNENSSEFVGFNGPNGTCLMRDFKNMKMFIRTRYNNMLRQRYCADNFGWKEPARMQICNGPNEYAAQIPAVVYWHDVAEKKGIENTFMRLPKKKGDSFTGAVVFDFSYRKLRPEEAEKFKIKADDHPELRDLINPTNYSGPDFELGKTLGDIQDFIVKISVDSGSHPSNPWMNEAIAKGYLGDNISELDQLKNIASLKKTVEKLEADEKKQRLKEKIREKRLKRQGK